jgi:hypothetical protein
MVDDDERGAVDGMSVRGNRSTPRKPAAVSLCLLQMQHDLAFSSNSDRFGGKPAPNHLSSGMAILPVTIILHVLAFRPSSRVVVVCSHSQLIYRSSFHCLTQNMTLCNIYDVALLNTVR